MNRRARITLALSVAALVGGLSLAASPAQGAYYVRSCFPDGIDTLWHPASGPHTAAYKSCPSGVYSRSNIGGGPAPGFSASRLTVNAPAGTYIDEIHFDGIVIQNRNWRAGIYDAQNGRWIWCGDSCGDVSIWSTFHIGGFATGSLALMTICGASECNMAGERANGEIAARNITLRLQDVWTPEVSIAGGSAVSGGWKSGEQTVEVSATDNSGVRKLTAFVDGETRDGRALGCDDHLLVSCPYTSQVSMNIDLGKLSDGAHTLDVQAVDSSGNVGAQRRTIFVDNSPPDPAEELSGTDGWQPTNDFTISWRNPIQAGGASIGGVTYQLCPDAPPDRQGCGPTERATKRDMTQISGVTVPAPGDWWLRMWLFDEAGNQNPQTAREVPLRWDPESPSVTLRDRDDADPARIDVKASDAVSGLASTEVELRRDGDATWHSLPVEPSSTGFTAVVDDATVPRGQYAIRARATDHAGNEKSDGASIALPVRLGTSLAVGRSKRIGARRAGRKKRRILIRRPSVRYGRTMKLSGRLTSPGGNPLADRDVDVAQQLKLPGAPWEPIATVRTGRSGRFVFKALPGPSRLLRFHYAGTPTIRSRTSVVDLRVRAASSMRASRHRVVNGEEVMFSGRVKGEPQPPTGKLLQLQVRSRGDWLTFATPRANARGRWRHRYRFTATRGVTRYRFRVRMPREAGYPYNPGTSRSVKVTVAGL